MSARVQGGISSSDLILSARIGGNADTFPDVLRLHVPVGSRIADVTYGRGVFWQQVDLADYDLCPSDIQTGVDCTDLPYPDASLDAVVLDPPYMEGLFRRSKGHLAGAGTHGAFRDAYSNGSTTMTGPKYHDAVLDLYYRAGDEAKRVLKHGGVFIVKCQDEVSAGNQRLTHVELINHFASVGFVAVDLFVVVRRNRPSVSRILRQRHARKNHSYFMVFRLAVRDRLVEPHEQHLEREAP